MELSERQYRNREKIRNEQAHQIQRDCINEYPNCTRCAFLDDTKRIWSCRFGTMAKDWRLKEWVE